MPASEVDKVAPVAVVERPPSHREYNGTGLYLIAGRFQVFERETRTEITGLHAVLCAPICQRQQPEIVLLVR